MAEIKPIETSYKGYRFRSRLEARWAVFFDALDIEWEYEADGYDLSEYGWYLPDFWLPHLRYIFEVKPSDYKVETDIEKHLALANALDGYFVIACGVPGWNNNSFGLGNINWVYKGAIPNDFIYGLHWGETFSGSYHLGSLLLARCVEEWYMDPFTTVDFDSTSTIESAYVAARSARFEHGENGRHS